MVTNIAIRDTDPATIPTIDPVSNPPELLVLVLELELMVPGALCVVVGIDPAESDDELAELEDDNEGRMEDVLGDIEGVDVAIGVLVDAVDIAPSDDDSTENG